MPSINTEILGMNARNSVYLRPNNLRSAVRLADNKLETKRILRRYGMPTPNLLAVIPTARELDEFDWAQMPSSFVIKPNGGLGGEGIIILKKKYSPKKEKESGLGNVFGLVREESDEPAWVGSDGRIWTASKLKVHVANILSGNFSIAGTSDIALIEQRIKLDPIFKPITPSGIPDIRVIVFNRVPVMAMLRLPTKRSNGKANLALGAIGVGIDLATGMATSSYVKKPRRQIIERHPDTNEPLSNIRIPYWTTILKMSIECQVASRLGFLGVDLALDKNYGPMVVELNARPGLEIQSVNQASLRRRLRRLYGLKVRTINKGVKVAKELFGGDTETTEEDRPVLGIIEPVEVYQHKSSKREKILAKIDTGATYTSIDRDVAARLGYKGVISAFRKYGLDKTMTRTKARRSYQRFRKEILQKYSKEIVDTRIIHSSHGTTYRILIPLRFMLSNELVETNATVMVRKHLRYPIIIGQRDLKKYIVDPSKRRHHIKTFSR
ncbi:sugar-transfer associated ATP-grasp domain-containing protein [Patescibacteria group bacterium]